MCLENNDEGDFVPNKLYPVLELLERDPKEYLRIIDESGEDYLYPEVYFQIVQLNLQAKENLLHYFELSAV